MTRPVTGPHRQEHDAREATAAPGSSVYTPLVLAVYDLWVLGLSNRFIWRCPSRQILDLYDRSVSANHLEVGVGTGYFPDHCRFPSPPRRLALLDANPHCLARAARRLARYQPEQHRANLLEPIAWDAERFDSIGLSYVLHCLPGTMPDKAAVLDRLLPLLNPGGVLFGSTILAEGVTHTRPARLLMASYNRTGVFSNAGDSLDAMRSELQSRFAASEIHAVGSVAMFQAVREGGTP